jgi:hypothetical protein
MDILPRSEVLVEDVKGVMDACGGDNGVWNEKCAGGDATLLSVEGRPN